MSAAREFRPIPGHVGYEVSRDGVVRNAGSHNVLVTRGRGDRKGSLEVPFPNVMLMATIEDQSRADARIAHLMALAGMGWKTGVSVEPMLGPVELTLPLHMQLDSHGCYRIGATLSWVIAGGETGLGARPLRPDWARDLRNQCKAAGVPFFFKGWGEWVPAGSDGQLLSDDADIPAGFEAERFDWMDGERAYRVGKRRSGRLLDDVEHNEFPELRP